MAVAAVDASRRPAPRRSPAFVAGAWCAPPPRPSTRSAPWRSATPPRRPAVSDGIHGAHDDVGAAGARHPHPFRLRRPGVLIEEVQEHERLVAVPHACPQGLREPRRQIVRHRQLDGQPPQRPPLGDQPGELGRLERGHEDLRREDRAANPGEQPGDRSTRVAAPETAGSGTRTRGSGCPAVRLPRST